MKFSAANVSAALTALAVLINAAVSAGSSLAHPALVGTYVFVAGLSIGALWYQYRASQAFILAVDPTKWQARNTEGAEIEITARQHKKGVGARVSLEMTTPDGDFELVTTDIRARPNGDVIVIVGSNSANFTGRIVIV